MAATKRKATRPPEAEDAASAALSWEEVERGAELYWPGLGRKVVRQMGEWNHHLFDDALTPAPIVLSRMSGKLGHWFPLIDPSADQVRGYETSAIFAATENAYRPPQPIAAVRRGDILRGMMVRLLREQGKSGRANSEAWCELVMRIHKRLTGKSLWCSIMVERRDEGPATMPDGIRRIAPTVTVREQPSCPKTGAASLPASEIAAWPLMTLDLGNIERDQP